jgi:hypothetical protein
MSQANSNNNSLVTPKVYYVLGNEVATLVNDALPADEYKVEFIVRIVFPMKSRI